MKKEEAVNYFKSNIENLKRILDKRPNLKGSELDTEIQASELAIKALEQQDRIIQILDDYDLEAWEILEMIKEAVRV
jgi:hypothetical protein